GIQGATDVGADSFAAQAAQFPPAQGAAPMAASSIPHEAVIPRLRTEVLQDEVSANTSQASQHAVPPEQGQGRVTLKELDDPALKRLMRKGRRLAHKIKVAIKSR
ncbi:MAG TPA: hypothetical protein DCY33_02750, partial [Gemmatimonadetes bacterium]|nr:hypothetical protein [Gemmatimonadota bacterium]